MNRRFVILRTIATIYKVLGIISAVLTLISIIGLCATTVLGGAFLGSFYVEFGIGSGVNLVGGAVGGIIVALITLLSGGGAALTFYAMGEGIYLLIALEENTRATAALLGRQNQ